MRVITDNRVLPRPALLALATVGWAFLLYLAWVVGQDSWERTMFSFAALSGQIPELDPFNERYRLNPVATLFHTVTGVGFAVLGPLQFMGPIRRRFPVIHRFSGYLFVVIGITSGLAALAITFLFPVWGARLNWISSAGFSVFMVFAFGNAVRHARARNFRVHREWMIRAFAVGMAVAFFRFALEDVLPRMGVEDFTVRWNIVSWSSFPILLLVAEFWIRVTRPRKAVVPAATAGAEVKARTAGA